MVFLVVFVLLLGLVRRVCLQPYVTLEAISYALEFIIIFHLITKTTPSHSVTALERINDFPDEILTHILSFLPSKDAFRTTVLSKRWLSLGLGIGQAASMDLRHGMTWHV
ncbi:FBD-associated F-box protein [Trifolium repens]|nr:FBD-associated F-box protein [Trifolium repens]